MNGQRIRTRTPHRTTNGKHAWRSGHGISNQHLNKREEPSSDRKRETGEGGKQWVTSDSGNTHQKPERWAHPSFPTHGTGQA